MSDDTRRTTQRMRRLAIRMETEVQLVCEWLEKEILPNLVIFVANHTHA